MRSSARGGVILIITQVVTTIISAFTLIWITRYLGSTGYGEYTLALFPVSLTLLIQDLGVNTALTRFCASNHNDEQYIRSIITTGLIFSIVTSLFISGTLYLFAEPIAVIYLKRPEIVPLVRAAAFSVFGGGGLVTTAQAIFVGYDNMKLSGFIQVVWSLLRTIFSLIFLLTGFGAFGAVVAYTASQVTAGIIGLGLLVIFLRFKPIGEGFFNFKVLQTIISFGLPLSLGSILNEALAQVYNYIMAAHIATDLIGNYGAAKNFSVFLTFITVPIATSLLPLFSKFRKGDPDLRPVFQLAVKYTTIITIPITLVIILLAAPLSRLLYGANDYPYVPLYLSIFILNYAWEGLGGMSLTSLISGLGETRVNLKANIITFIAGILLFVILVPQYQMVGLLFTIVLDSRAGWLYQILWLKRKLAISVDWVSSAKIYLAGFISFIISYLLINTFSLQGWIRMVVGGTSYLLIYLVSLLFMGALKSQDLRQMESISDMFGPISPLINSILSILSRFTKQ